MSFDIYANRIIFQGEEKVSTVRDREQVQPNNWLYLGYRGDVFGSHIDYWNNSPYRERCLDSTHPGPPYKVGGALDISKAKFTFSPSHVYDAKLGNRFAKTMFIPIYFGNAPALLNYVTPRNYSSWESKGWSKFRPGKPEAHFGQFLGELSRLPTIPLRQILQNWRRLDFFRRSGSEYLNVQFGWLPFVKDLQDMYKLTKNLDRRLAQLRRDNGRSVRRRGSVARTAVNPVVTETVGTYLYPVLTTEFYTSLSGKRTVVTTDTETAWFSAKFRYFVRDIGSLRWENRAVAALFGLNPTPSLLWELLPFSWLIDWGVNVGDVLSNMSANAVDNLAAEYAFLMVKRTFTDHVEEQMTMKNSNGTPHLITASVDRVWETKQRFRASPYGFGIVPGGLSGKQALILSALGISRRW